MERRFCCAKSVACGRVIEREWGNPSKVPPSHSPFLAVGGSAGNKTCGQSQKETPSDRMGYSFWNAAGRLELAASTSAKRVKSRGKGRAPANGSAIRGMPGSEFEPRLFCCAKSVACGRVTEREWGNPSKVPPSHSPFLAMCGSATAKPVGSHKKKHHPDRMVFLFGMSRAGWNSLPRPARSASNRSVGDGVPDVPSARRCRAGNGFPRRFAPRSKCPWGTDWRGNPFPNRIIPALFRRFPAKRLRIPTPVTSVTGSE